MPDCVRKDGTVAHSEGPARNYKWADATPANRLAVRHGAHSEALVSERAAALLAGLVERWPWLEDCDAVVVDVLCRAKARYEALDEYAAAVISGEKRAYPRQGYPDTGVEAVPDRVWQSLQRQENIILQASAKLGFTAVDRAAILRDTGVAKHLAGGRAARLSEVGEAIRARRLRELS